MIMALTVKDHKWTCAWLATCGALEVLVRLLGGHA